MRVEKKLLWLVVGSLLALSLVLSSCAETAEEEEEEIVGEHWWDKFGEPEYGGTLTLQVNYLDPGFDNITFFGGEWQLWFEKLWTNDWTLDRDTFSFKTMFCPEEFQTGLLAESWELPDYQTIIVNIRQGVHWQDIPPVNGREFTAHDIEFHYDRMMGTGSGFTQGSPIYMGMTKGWEKVRALDDYKVEFKFKQPTALGLMQIMDPFALNTFEAPESVQQGLIGEWENALGTGAWILTDYISGSSMTFDKNPNYWGWDERHPENQVPYVDELKITCIPDKATALAALRSGQIDILEGLSWEHAQSLERTNPELKKAKMTEFGRSCEIRCDTEPYTDINVRKALQMAIDREMIAETYYAGTVEGTPVGLVNPQMTGYCLPYEDWPDALKAEYSYNPERAMELLSEVGYPDGFKTNIIAASDSDLELLQIIISQFLEIGVDMEIKAMEHTAWTNACNAGTFDGMVYEACAFTQPPNIIISMRSSEEIAPNNTYNNDAVYDALVAEFFTTPEPGRPAEIMVEADRRCIEQHWSVNLFPLASYNFYQPYLKGYDGEILMWGQQHYYARMWIDQDQKQSMGR